MYSNTIFVCQKMNNLSVVLIDAYSENRIRSYRNKLKDILNNKKKLLDYHVNYFYKYYKRSKIFIIDDTPYVDDRVTFLKRSKPTKNIGQDIRLALEFIQTEDVVFMSTDIVLKREIQHNEGSIVLSCKNISNVGCFCLENSLIENCFYDLENKILNYLKLTNEHVHILKNIANPMSIDNSYMFEIINLLVNQKQDIYIQKIKPKDVVVIDNVESIKGIK